LPFFEPIMLPDGSALATLREAYDHLKTFPISEQDAEEWKAAAHCLIEAAEHGGAIAFARIGTLRAMRQRADRTPTLELIDLTMWEVQQLTTNHTDPISRDREGVPSSPEVMKVIVAFVSSPAVPVEIERSDFNATKPCGFYQIRRRQNSNCVRYFAIGDNQGRPESRACFRWRDRPAHHAKIALLIQIGRSEV
jgi:hypothetical protein